jgi:tRNA-dihydrouridine synthase
MRKHFKAYCSGFPGAHELRAKLMETKNLEDTRKIVEEFLRQHPEIENPQSTTA